MVLKGITDPELRVTHNSTDKVKHDATVPRHATAGRQSPPNQKWHQWELQKVL